MRSRYRFEGSLCVPAPPTRVRDVLVDLEHYPEWWPQFLAVARVGPDEARVLCRSALPHTLDLRLHAVSRALPVLEVAVAGDLEGSVRWTLHPTADGTRVETDQDVDVVGPLAWVSPFARPLLRWNHARMMAGCRAGLRGVVADARRP